MQNETVTRIATESNQYTKSVNKKDAHALFVNLIKQLPADMINENFSQLATLYKYFLPPVPKTPKTHFDAAQLFKAKKDVRYYLNYVYIDDEGRYLAATGHIAIRININSGLPTGYYDAAETLTNIDAKYPNVAQLLQHDKSTAWYGLSDVKTELTRSSAGINAYRVTLGGSDLLIQKTYWDTAMSVISDLSVVSVTLNHSGAIYMQDSTQEIVIMPMRD